MTIRIETLAAAAAIAAAAVPAAAQPAYPYGYAQQAYPQQAYPGSPQQSYGYGQQGYTQSPVQQVIDGLLGNRYNVTDRQAVSRCAAAAMTQAAAQVGNNGSGQRYGNNGYSRRYNDAMRV